MNENMTEYTIYPCVDEDHNTYRCAMCGHLASFEEDGPFEEGWSYCPHCGRTIGHSASIFEQPEEEQV